MDYDDFDYLDGNLMDWMMKFDSGQEPRNQTTLISDEFLPRFERAIHRLHSTSNAAWTHPHIEQLPLTVVTADEETISDMVSEGGPAPEHVKNFLTKNDSYKNQYSVVS